MKQWESQFPTGSGQYQFAEDVINEIKNANNKGESFGQMIADLIKDFYKPRLIGPHEYDSRDIYMKYGLIPSQATAIDTIFSGKFGTPTVTKMDQMYADAAAWIKTTLAPQDVLCAQALMNKLRGWGSPDSNMGNFLQDLQQWKSDYTIYKNASPQAQTILDAISGFKPSALTSYLEQVEHWQEQFQQGTPQYALAKDIIQQCFNAIGNKTDIGGLVALIRKNVIKDPKGLPDDIYMRYFGLTHDQMAGLAADFPGLNTPDFTQMDTNYQAIQKWLADPHISADDKQLALALLQQINLLGSDNSKISALKDWAQNFLQNFTYINATPAGQATFRTLTGAAN